MTVRYKIFDLLAFLVIMGVITTIVTHPNSKKGINAVGKLFADSLRAATGK